MVEADVGDCKTCGHPIIEIDYYGERLFGCIECNRWSSRGSKRLSLKMPEEDLGALQTIRDGESER